MLWSRPLLTPRHHHCEGRPPALQTCRAGVRPLHHLFSLNLKHSSRQVALTSLEHVLGGQSPRNLTAPEFRQVVDRCLSLDQPIKPDCTAWKLKVEE
ncbi:hypothetical protein SAMCFNEI73_pC0177 (plasmid) [Sinorhizobium americanum]|uniref:Uncharacterized protein n=1 Tax=Sinorhizobium americanum TaxID=194963 RepID=A0A1L3LV08_9HYPH|nr:hypothetical protein SAMCFNEI73_pC0177 [Sinorhizobium americanum]